METTETTPQVPGAPSVPPAPLRRRGRRGGPAAAGALSLRRAGRFVPALTGYLLLAALLYAADTTVSDIARYTFYALWGVLLPGTLVFRALRRRPHTLVEDLVLGAVCGLVLELAAWAVLVGFGLQAVATAWPLAVVVPFAVLPRLRGHWRPVYPTRPSAGWSWAVAGTVVATGYYYYESFLTRFPVLPDSENTRLFGDLPYLLSLAGNAKQHMPLTVPQAAGEPLHYHWFTFAHMAMTDLVGHIDLAVVEMRLMVPALSALTMLVIAVVAHRLTGRLWAGPTAAVLLFAVGQFSATYPNVVGTWYFGAPAVRLMSWSSLSLTYSQPLLIALLGVVGDRLRRRPDDAGVPLLGPGAVVLAGMLAIASAAAKASTLPVTLAGLAVAGLAQLIGTRRVPWPTVGLGAVLVSAQLLITAAVFNFESYGLEVIPLGNIRTYWSDPQNLRPTTEQALIAGLTVLAFLVHHQLRLVGTLPLLWRSRMRLDALQWFLLGASLAGPAAYLVVNGYNASYFTIAAMPFTAVLSAWGYCEAMERAALPVRGRAAVAALAVGVAAGLSWLMYHHSADWRSWIVRTVGRDKDGQSYSVLLPILGGTAALAAVAAAVAVLWWLLARPVAALRRRGGVVVLTVVLAAGVPGVVLDTVQAREVLWEGSWVVPASQVQAARWVRAHSEPTDVIATNSHCWEFDGARTGTCTNYRSQWLSGYSEREVLVEGWAYAPRMIARSVGGVASTEPFWDQELFRLNEDALYRPTAEGLKRLHGQYKVRYLVAHRMTGDESPLLGGLAVKVFDNGPVAVYELS